MNYIQIWANSLQIKCIKCIKYDFWGWGLSVWPLMWYGSLDFYYYDFMYIYIYMHIYIYIYIHIYIEIYIYVYIYIYIYICVYIYICIHTPAQMWYGSPDFWRPVATRGNLVLYKYIYIYIYMLHSTIVICICNT